MLTMTPSKVANGTPCGINEIWHFSQVARFRKSPSSQRLTAIDRRPHCSNLWTVHGPQCLILCGELGKSIHQKALSTMPDELLLHELTIYLGSRTANRVCRPYGAAPFDAFGDLYIRLHVKARQPIREPKAWVRANAAGLLRNFLRAEYRRLGQSLEV